LFNENNAGPLPVFNRRIPLLNPFIPNLTSFDEVHAP